MLTRKKPLRPKDSHWSLSCADTAAHCLKISDSIAWMPIVSNRAFIDTSVLLYLLSNDTDKADRAEQVLTAGGTVSVQVLNEFAAVAHRKLQLAWPALHHVLSILRAALMVKSVSLVTHSRGVSVSERYGFSVYDSMIVASALESGCTTLITEDLQHDQRIEGLRIFNPFRVD